MKQHVWIFWGKMFYVFKRKKCNRFWWKKKSTDNLNNNKIKNSKMCKRWFFYTLKLCSESLEKKLIVSLEFNTPDTIIWSEEREMVRSTSIFLSWAGDDRWPCFKIISTVHRGGLRFPRMPFGARVSFRVYRTIPDNPGRRLKRKWCRM